jgi:hypothetical protein
MEASSKSTWSYSESAATKMMAVTLSKQWIHCTGGESR